MIMGATFYRELPHGWWMGMQYQRANKFKYVVWDADGRKVVIGGRMPLHQLDHVWASAISRAQQEG